MVPRERGHLQVERVWILGVFHGQPVEFTAGLTQDGTSRAEMEEEAAAPGESACCSPLLALGSLLACFLSSFNFNVPSSERHFLALQCKGATP